MRKVEASRIDKIYTDLYKDSAAEAPSLQSPELGQQDKPVFWLFLSFFFFFFLQTFLFNAGPCGFSRNKNDSHAPVLIT